MADPGNGRQAFIFKLNTQGNFELIQCFMIFSSINEIV